MGAEMSSEGTYYIPEPSHWPIVAAVGVFVLVTGFVFWLNGLVVGPVFTFAGLGILSYLLYGWLSDVVDESLKGKYDKQVDISFRQGMIWFIISEVFFFASFFGTLYYIRNIAIPYLGGEGHLGSTHMLWEGFTATWPLIHLPDPTNYSEAKEAMGAGGIPLINTIILLTSGVTITWAHWALKKENRTQLILGMLSTVALGVVFLFFQAYEYGHAYSAMNLTLQSGSYGSTFYMLTGFHGFHVTIGTIMLIVITIRCFKGHFTKENHFAFEGVAWYWHFVDVVWLGLYIFVYWL